MKTIALFLFALAASQVVHAQYPPDWVVASSDFYKMGSMLATDSQGNAVMTGDRSAFIGNANIFTRKLDIDGNLLWETTELSGIPSSYLKASWVNVDNEDNILVTGFRYSGVSINYTDSIIVLKYNSAGTEIWRTSIAHPFPSGIPLRSEIDEFGNLYMGTIASNIGFNLMKIDTEGNVVFNVGNASTANQSFNNMRVKDGKVAMTSYAANGTVACLVVFDTSGTFLWGHTYSSFGGTDVEIDNDGNVFLLTREANQVGPSTQFDMKIIKVNPSGTLLNEYSYDFGNSTEFPVRMTLVNNKISIIGSSILSGGAYMDWITFQIDLNGNKLWDARYNEMLSNDEIPYWITALDNGDVYVSGKGGPPFVDFNGSVYLKYVALRYNQGEIQWSDTHQYQGYTGKVNALDLNGGLYVMGETSMTLVHYNDAVAVPCTGDYNDDGVINNTDLLVFLTYFGCTNSCPGDLNGDTVCNMSDVLMFLGLLGSACN
jgi:hypothetical protein